MALYTNFALEAETEIVAASAVARFREPLVVYGTELAIEKSEVFEKEGMWYFCAEPAGYTNGCHVVPELNTPAAFTAVREACYTRLERLSDFRRALFAHEALDFLSDPEARSRLDCPDMIVREDLVQDSATKARCQKFSPGYLRVREKKENSFRFEARQ